LLQYLSAGEGEETGRWQGLFSSHRAFPSLICFRVGTISQQAIAKKPAGGGDYLVHVMPFLASLSAKNM